MGDAQSKAVLRWWGLNFYMPASVKSYSRKVPSEWTAKDTVKESVTLTVSAKPVLDTTETSIEVSQDGNSATITWSITNANSFTHMLVEVCEVVQQQCLELNVTDVSTPSQISIPGGVAYNLFVRHV